MFATTNNQKRFVYIDLLKLFASILVIFSHCVIKFIDGGTANPFFNFIWLTQMPIFMFTSGFLNITQEKYSTLKKFFKIQIKNAISLLVPCLSFLFVSSAINNSNIIDSFIKFYFDPQTNLWFLWALFVIHFIFDIGLYFSNFIRNKFSQFFPVFLALLICAFATISMFIPNNNFNYSILSIKLICYYIPFYCFGFLFHKIIKNNFFISKGGKIISLVLFLICLIILLFECLYFKSIYSFSDNSIKEIFIRILGSFASIYVVFTSFYTVSKMKFFKKIAFLGSYSLQSYYLHIIFLGFFNFSIPGVFSQWLSTFAIACILIIMIALSLLLIYFIPFSHLFLFGKSFSFYKIEKQMFERRKQI